MPKSKSHPYHSDEKRNQFVGAMIADSQLAKHSRTFNIPFHTARKIWKKYRETGSVSDRPKSGRPKKVTPEMESEMVETARENRRLPFCDIGNMTDPPVGATTVANVLDGVGMHRRVARHVPYLTEKHKEDWMAWARRNKGMRMRGWERILWSDECYIHLTESSGRIWVTRTVEEVYDQDCLVPELKDSSVRVMVWGCIAHGWKGPLVVLKYPGGPGGGMTAKRYQQQVLDKYLLNTMKTLREERGRRIRIYFQQDGASCHTAKSTCDWLKRHKVHLFPHPACSPDVSPIEPVWHELKKRVRCRQPRPTSFETLKAAIMEEWDAMPIDDINKHTGRMIDRVQAVLDAEGGHTRF
ncbi:unnamed protein product [Mycena citricolor]|uniref:Tc1-like transposase DDE domain-containing protein n=1 Tax=Mycena citricolor TaxID=2018698 RepID=A0AAD2HLP6_9AGAR|nr:unnamed protein product [Mycena citricolor]